MEPELKKIIEEEGTVLTAFERSAEKYPDKSALIFLGTSFTYARLRELTYRFATAARDLGVQAGGRVLIYLPNSPQWLAIYMGLQKIGAVPVPISPIYPPYELTYLLNHSGAKMIICGDTNFGYVKEVLPKTGVEKIVVTQVADLLPIGKWVFGRIFDKLTEGSVSRHGNVFFFNRLMRKYPPTPPRVDIDFKNQLAHILYTGGTTGFPKGVPHGHLELLSGIVGIREVYRSCIRATEHTLIMPLPLFHMFTQDMIFALGLHLGNTVVIAPKPNTDAVLAAIQNYRGSLLAGVPSLYRLILDNDRLGFYDLKSLRYCWSAGDTLPTEVASRWQEKVGCPIFQVYGSTEAVCISVTSPDPSTRAPALAEGSGSGFRPTGVLEGATGLPVGLHKSAAARSVGRLIPTRLARVVDPEALKPIAPEEGGNCW
jgi:long-chain acyl-CoA synthetase